MSDAPNRRFDVWADPAARTYLTLGLVAALALGLALMQHAEGIWAVVPTLVAITGLMFRWLSAPVFMLLGVALSLLVTQQQFHMMTSPINDVLLAGCVVAVILAHFRLYSITSSILPHDPRRTLDPSRPRHRGPPVWIEILMVLTIVPYIVYLIRRKRPSQETLMKPERRDCVLAIDEWPAAVGSVAICAVASVVLWAVSERIPPPRMTVPEQWRLGLMIWFALMPVFIVAAFVGYRHARRRSPTEARLLLTDELWSETRGDQRRIVRWINRARLKQDNQRLEKLP